MTDILARSQWELTQHRALPQLPCFHGDMVMFRSLYPMDINGDGLAEGTQTGIFAGMRTTTSEDLYQRIDWNSFLILTAKPKPS